MCGDTQLLPARSLTAGVLPHCACQDCRAATRPALVVLRHVATDGVPEQRSAESSLPPSPCQTHFDEHCLGPRLMEPLHSDSSASASLCCDRDADYRRVEMAHDGRLDDGAAAAVARPTAATSTDFKTQAVYLRPTSPVIDMK